MSVLALLLTVALTAPQVLDAPAASASSREAAVSPPSGSAAIHGRVIAGGSPSAPVPLAIVTVSGAAGDATRSFVTGEDGTFRFTGLPAGRFTLIVRKPAFLDATFGSPGPDHPGTVIVLTAGQQVTLPDVRVWRGAVVTGIVRGPTGLPVSNVSVGVARANRLDGEVTFGSRVAAGATDDRGMYRLFGLAPGDYVVSVTPPGPSWGVVQTRTDAHVDEILRRLQGRTQPGAASSAGYLVATSRLRGLATAYFPGTSDPAEAELVHLEAGEERSGIDLALTMVPIASVSGAIVAADWPVPPVQLALQTLGSRPPSPLNSPPVVSPTLVANVGPDGAFKYAAVPPGRYRLAVRTSGASAMPGARTAGGALTPSPQPLWGATEFTVVGEDIEGIVVTLQPALSVSGHIRFDAASLETPRNFASVRLSLVSTAGARSTISRTVLGPLPIPDAQISPDGRFVIRGVLPGAYRLVIDRIPTGWLLRSAITEGRDVVDLPLEISAADISDLTVTFTDRQGQLSGRLQTTASEPASNYVVLAFATEPALWRPGSRWVRLARPATDGVFTLEDLPGGEYFVALVTAAAMSDAARPEFLEQATREAVRVVIGEGERKTQDFSVGR